MFIAGGGDDCESVIGPRSNNNTIIMNNDSNYSILLMRGRCLAKVLAAVASLSLGVRFNRFRGIRNTSSPNSSVPPLPVFIYQQRRRSQ